LNFNSLSNHCSDGIAYISPIPPALHIMLRTIDGFALSVDRAIRCWTIAGWRLHRAILCNNR